MIIKRSNSMNRTGIFGIICSVIGLSAALSEDDIQNINLDAVDDLSVLIESIDASSSKPTALTVIALMGVVGSDNSGFHKPFVADNKGAIDAANYEAPSTYAIRLLSRMVPSPPMTYKDIRWDPSMYFERALWMTWWAENSSAFEKGDVEVKLRVENETSKDESNREKLRLSYVYDKTIELNEHQRSALGRGENLDYFDLVEEEIQNDPKLGSVGWKNEASDKNKDKPQAKEIALIAKSPIESNVAKPETKPAIPLWAMILGGLVLLGLIVTVVKRK